MIEMICWDCGRTFECNGDKLCSVDTPLRKCFCKVCKARYKGGLTRRKARRCYENLKEKEKVKFS
jgi:hypothetical protein